MQAERSTSQPTRVGVGWVRFFLAAGLFNLLGGAVGLADPTRPWLEHGMPPPLYTFPLRLLFASVMLFGVGLLMVWRDPQRHRGIVVLALGAKLLGLGFTVWALVDGQLPTAAWWQPVVADLPWAVGFALFLWRVPEQAPAPASA